MLYNKKSPLVFVLGAFLRDNLEMGSFSYHRFIFLLACIDRWRTCNRLVSAWTVKTAIEAQCLCALTSKNGTFVGLLRFSSPFLIVYAVTNQAN